MNNILRMPDGDGGGDSGNSLLGGASGSGALPSDWRTSIPETIRGEPCLKDFKGIGDLAQSFVHAQKLIGTEKLPKPQANWKPEQYDEFWNSLGRPAKPEEYTFKPEKLPDGVVIDETKMGETKKFLHSLGLSDKQASGALNYYLESIGKQTTEIQQLSETQKQTAVTQLKTEWGDKFDTKINIAQAVVKKFGNDDDVKTTIEKIGNDPGFIKLFASIGESMMEDSATGSGNDLIVLDSTRAVQEINQLKSDKDFMSSFMNRSDPGHKAAIERWSALHAKAYSEKE